MWHHSQQHGKSQHHLSIDCRCINHLHNIHSIEFFSCMHTKQMKCTKLTLYSSQNKKKINCQFVCIVWYTYMQLNCYFISIQLLTFFELNTTQMSSDFSSFNCYFVNVFSDKSSTKILSKTQQTSYKECHFLIITVYRNRNSNQIQQNTETTPKAMLISCCLSWKMTNI